MRTLDVPSCAVLRTFHASLATVHVFINLNMFLSTPLKIALRAFEFSSASSSSSLDQSSSFLRVRVVEDPSVSLFTGGVHPLIIAFHVLLSMDLRKVVMRTFQVTLFVPSNPGGILIDPPSLLAIFQKLNLSGAHPKQN